METRPEQDIQETQQNIEARVRNSAPTLPPELRQRVLRRCRNERRNKPALTWFGQWRLASALACLVLCWLASNWLDAQNQAIIAGTNGRLQGITLAVRADVPVSNEAGSQNFGAALRWRIQQLALLLHDKHSG